MSAPTAIQTIDDRSKTLYSKPEHTAETTEVAHILLAFKGIPDLNQKRSKEEAAALAVSLMDRLAAGEDFLGLMREHSNDPGPGVYKMALKPAGARGETYPRNGMVAAFGDVAWRLEVGQVGVATHDPKKSPFGYHIIKRLA